MIMGGILLLLERFILYFSSMRTNQAGRLSNVVYFLALVAFCSFKVILAETKTKKPKKLSIKKRPFPCPKFLNRSLVGCLNPLSDQL